MAYHANLRWIRTELVDCLWIAARLATAPQQYPHAATLFGLAEQLHSQIHHVIGGPMRALADDALQPAAFAAAFAVGQGMTLAEVYATFGLQDRLQADRNEHFVVSCA